MPPLADILERLHVVALPMRVAVRGITVRELALIDCLATCLPWER